MSYLNNKKNPQKRFVFSSSGEHMIIKINNKKKKIAKEIRAIFQVSYTVEASILKVVDFPR